MARLNQVARSSSRGFCFNTDRVATKAVKTLKAQMAMMVKAVVQGEKLHKPSKIKKDIA